MREITERDERDYREKRVSLSLLRERGRRRDRGVGVRKKREEIGRN